MNSKEWNNVWILVKKERDRCIKIIKESKNINDKKDLIKKIKEEK